MNKSQVSSAVAISLGKRELADHVASNKAKAEAPTLSARELAEGELSPDQVDMLDEFAAAIVAHGAERETYISLAIDFINALFPTWPEYAAWKASGQYIGFAVDKAGGNAEYGKNCLRNAFRIAFNSEDLPSKSGKRGDKRSAARWAQGLASEGARMMARLKDAPKGDIPAAHLKRLGQLMTQVALEIKALRRDVA